MKDWEERRYELAKAVFTDSYDISCTYKQDIASLANLCMAVADETIKEWAKFEDDEMLSTFVDLKNTLFESGMGKSVSARTYNCLCWYLDNCGERKTKEATLFDVFFVPADEARKIRNFGKRCFEEVCDYFSDMGYDFISKKKL